MIAAIDAGGTNIRAQIFDDQEKLIGSEFMNTGERGLIEAIESLLAKYPIKNIGISYAGQVHNGMILTSPNIQVDEPHIQAYFWDRHRVELAIENDLKCAALAEYRYWGCKSTMIAASIGTGFGSAIIDHGKIFRGSHNLAGEIGHAPYRYSDIPCGCGNHFCIEASCSGSALIRRIEHHKLGIKDDLLEELKLSNDPKAREILDHFHEGLLFALGSLIATVNPELIVLGGGVIHKNPYLVDLANEQVERFTLQTARKQTKIVLSQLEEAPLLGAKLLCGYKE